ncbi:LytTR family DNA-binding domain-containing protein [Emticicia sp. BO119]|uniref:LytR/AlgR family response regulator transcription factor n=1 Tax=Emticicia sp. BO119 TaxID=2757768 RepID=UPI0015F0F15C|nr:LytTR family DNA-binding domain-containing protein [Emticicia sp. BO119]MBA4850747.1 LytTR family transcriptional regulator [Emticicia sp. BO119]
MKHRMKKNCITIYPTENPSPVLWMLYKNRRVRVFLDDIIYLESQANYTVFYLKNGRAIINSRTMGIFENLFEHKSFFRVHRSFIVNLHYIDQINIIKHTSGVIGLRNGKQLLLSRRKIKPFLQEFVNCENANPQVTIHIINQPIAA